MINNSEYVNLLSSSQILYEKFDRVDGAGGGEVDGQLDVQELKHIVNTTDDSELKAAAEFFLKHQDAFNIVDDIISGESELGKAELGKAASGAGFAGFVKLGLDHNYKYYFSVEGEQYHLKKDGDSYKAYDRDGRVVDDDVQIRNDGTPGFVEISNEKGLLKGLNSNQSLYVGGRSADTTERLLLKGDSGITADGPYELIDKLTGAKGEITLGDKPAQVPFDDWLQSKLDEGYTFKFSSQNENYSIKKVGDFYKAFKAGSSKPIDEYVQINNSMTIDGWVEIGGIESFSGADGSGRLFLGSEPDQPSEVIFARGHVDVESHSGCTVRFTKSCCRWQLKKTAAMRLPIYFVRFHHLRS